MVQEDSRGLGVSIGDQTLELKEKYLELVEMVPAKFTQTSLVWFSKILFF